MDYQFYNISNDCVLENASALTLCNSSVLVQLADLPCVVQKKIDKTKVSVICGGGSGHEPAHAGFVGKGMLSGAVAGSVFASPSTSLILKLIYEVTGERGCLVIVKNYTGDRLNFGKAVQKAKQAGLKVEMVIVADDTTLLDKDTLAGPRGLCGVLFVQKIAGALADQGCDLETVATTARRLVQVAPWNIGTAAVAISSCVPPGKPPSFQLPPNTMEFGVGLHGEPGVLRCGSVNCKSTVSKLFSYLCDKRGLRLMSGEQVAIILNNLGGTSTMEMGIVTHEVKMWLNENNVSCPLFYTGVLVSSLGMHGVSISVLRLDKEGRLVELLKHATTAPYWPTATDLTLDLETSIPLTSQHYRVVQDYSAGHVSSELITEILNAVCKDLTSNVPMLDELDRVSGDGDCGSTILGLVTALKPKIKYLNCASLSLLLTQLADIVEENMGGTSGALYTIGLMEAANKCKHIGDDIGSITVDVLICALQAAVSAISEYGNAKLGDCTMLDVLIPVLNTLQVNRSTEGGVISTSTLCIQAAENGVLNTKSLVPRAGRASYIGTQKTDKEDPGALATAIWIKAICRVLYQRNI